MAQSAYHRILQRIKESLEQAEEVTVEALKQEIDQAIELEETAEEMTREELDLLGAYLKQDMTHLSRFVSVTGKGVADWLKFDLHLLEDKLAELLLSVADQTSVAQRKLEWELKKESDDIYKAGAMVVGGTFACINCGDIYVCTQPMRLAPCIECGGDRFQRKSADS